MKNYSITVIAIFLGGEFLLNLKRIGFVLTVCVILFGRVWVVQAELNHKVAEQNIETLKREILAMKDVYLTVGEEGCDFSTVKEALAAVREGRNVVWIMDEIHTESQIQVGVDVTIRGFGPERTIIQAANDLESSAGRVFQILEGASVRLEGLTIRHGRVEDVPRGGGGVQNYGNLFIERCVIRDNVATYGVGVHNRGQLEMRDSEILANQGKPRPLEDERRAVDCGGSGAGIKVQAHSTARLINCLIADNVSVVNGGGIHVSCEGRAILINCTLIRNTAKRHGGGVSVRGDLELIHCTITENHGIQGSGVFTIGKVDMVATLIAGNKGRDFFLGSGGYGYYGRGILGKNEYNFIGDGKPESYGSGNPNLLPLSDNGGPTMTCALQPDSPAVGAIPEGISFVETDQRGMPRKNGPSDIGAYETE